MENSSPILQFRSRSVSYKKKKKNNIESWRIIDGIRIFIGCSRVRSSTLKKRAPEKAGKKRGKRERLTRRGYLRALCKRDVGPRDLLLLDGAKEKQYT